jgi:predicted HTH transcriptional regulator
VTETGFNKLLREVTTLPHEAEWVEFKCNYANPEEIGEYLSAIANAAALHRKERGYVIWGVDDTTHKVVGTKFKPRQEKKGNEELENWLARLLEPRLDFRIHEFEHEGKVVVLLEVPSALHTPVRFMDIEYIRVGTYKKKLKDYPEKERTLWAIFRRETFETGLALRGLTADEVIALIDYPSFFQLLGQSLPESRSGILDRLVRERVVMGSGEGLYDITNLGAVLFARRLGDFEPLARKAIRVVLYKGPSRVETIKEQAGSRGYAVGFTGLLTYINDQLPRNEEIGRALRREVRIYPELAIRELVANALIHQDFSLTGTGPMVEVFPDRIEITNPGTPLIDTLRFIDEPPRSRNEILAALMRRMNICEERGSGIDKVIFQVELFQLPAPDFQVTSNHTKVILYAPKKLAEMSQGDRIRACYQHACLCWVSDKPMTNASMRQRFGIEEKNYPMASRIIAEALKAGLIKPADPESKSKRLARYVPFWL